MIVSFTPQDYAKVTFTPSLMHQLMLTTFATFQRRATLSRYGAQTRLQQLPEHVRPLFELFCADPLSLPDFLTPLPDLERGQAGVDDAIDAFDAAPDHDVESGLEPYLRVSTATPFVRALAQGDSRARAVLSTALRRTGRATFGPEWPRVQDILATEVDRQGLLMARHGLDHALARVHPAIGYRPLALHVPTASGDQCVHALDGQGLIFVPVSGPGGRFSVGAGPEGSAVITYPVKALAGTAPTDAPRETLDDVIGRARASVLHALSSGLALTTTDISNQCALSMASASEHATSLRRAGLVSSERDGNKMLHRITPLGRRLVYSN